MITTLNPIFFLVLFSLFFSILGILQVLPDIHYFLFHFPKKIWPNNDPTWLSQLIGVLHFLSYKRLKQDHLQRCLILVVMHKIHQLQIVLPFWWFSHHIHPKYIVYHLIDPFYFSIWLQIKFCTIVDIGFKSLDLIFPKIWCKLEIPTKNHIALECYE